MNLRAPQEERDNNWIAAKREFDMAYERYLFRKELVPLRPSKRVRWYSQHDGGGFMPAQIRERRRLLIARKGRMCDRFTAVTCEVLPKKWLSMSRAEKRRARLHKRRD